MDMWSKYIKLYNSFHYTGLEEYEGTIYHYTSPNGLKGIFDTECLFATDMYYLNDSSEGMYVINLIKENINDLCFGDNKFAECVNEEIKLIEKGKWKELIHNYTTSFSLNGDSLEMWNYYTKGNSIQGYNIGFNAKNLSKNMYIEILDDSGKQVQRNEVKHLVLYHGKIIYEEDKQLELIRGIFEAFYNLYKETENEEFLETLAHFVVGKTLDYGKFFKPKEFAVEDEYRFMYSTYLMEGIDNSQKGIPCNELFRVHEGCLIPYQKCKFNKECIEEITFSPSLHNEMAEAGLNRMLSLHGIAEKVTVKKSNIPLRF